MKRNPATDSDVAVWKQQIGRVATVFDMLALAVSGSALLAHLAGTTSPASGIPPLPDIVQRLSTVAASPALDQTATSTTLQHVLRDAHALVDLTRRLLQRSMHPASRPLDDASFLLHDYLPRLERAVSALEHLHMQMPRVSTSQPRRAGPPQSQSLTLIPPGRPIPTPPLAFGEHPTTR